MNNDKLYSEEMELSAVAKVFQNPKRFLPLVRQHGLEANHFFVPQYRQIFLWAIDRYENGGTFERRVLMRDFAKSPLNTQIGGDDRIITDLMTYRMDEYESYEEIIDRIKADAALRIASQAASGILEGIHTTDPQSAVRSLSDAIERISDISRPKSTGYDAEEAAREFAQEMKLRLDGQDELTHPTGVAEIDEVTNGGFRNGEFIVIAAPTSGGKSVLSLQSVIPAIKDGKRVAIFSMEMGVKEVMGRLISAIGGVGMGNIIRPQGMIKGEMLKIKTALAILKESKITIWDEAAMSMDFIAGQLEDQPESPDIVVVDYVQLVEGIKGARESREQEVARISKKLKQLAKRFDCPVISPSQINDDGRIRESRAIAHDADIVLQIKPDEGIFVAKNRNGKRGVNLELELNGVFQRFEKANFGPPPKKYEKFTFQDGKR